MVKYYCPYCQSNYKFKRVNQNNIYICSQCGENLYQIKISRRVQITAFIVIAGFVTPLILSLSTLLHHQFNPKNQNNSSVIIT